jgi:hypothetical protein
MAPLRQRSDERHDKGANFNVIEIRFALARAYESSGKIDEALTQYKEILRESSPEDPDHQVASGELERLEGAASKTSSGKPTAESTTN